MLSKLMKVYLLSLVERNSLNRWIDEELRKVLEWPVLLKSTKHSQALQISICKFSMNFIKISRLLSNLTKKDSIWTERIEQQNVLKILKKAFIIVPVLRVSNDEKSFKSSTDTSKFATRAVLSQKHQLLGYGIQILLLKSLYIHEINYKIYNKELLAII